MKGLRRKTALIMAFLFVLAALTACGQKGRLRIGTAGEGGNYNSLGKALSQTLQKDPYKINVEVKTTAGSAANIRLLSQDYLELAIAQSDVIGRHAGYAGNEGILCDRVAVSGACTDRGESGFGNCFCK